MTTILLGGAPLGINDVVAVARDGARVGIAHEARSSMEDSRAVVERFSASDRPVYGLTRGLGGRVVNQVEQSDREDYSRVVVLARACGAGEPLPEEAVRAAMFSRAAGMAQGGAGVRPLIAETLCAMLEKGVHPLVPGIGSIGASDLALCANMALPVIGEGRAWFRGALLDGADAMTRAGIDVVDLHEKEGLALCSSNAISVGQAALVIADLQHLLELMDGIVVLGFEAFRANPGPIDPRVVMARGAPGQARAALSLRNKLEGTVLFDPEEPRRVQDPISLRCVSHVHGSLRAAIDFATPNVTVELNGAGDNPLVLAADGDILSTGNFHTPAMAVAFDALTLAMAQTATMAAQRLGRLLQNQFSGLPDMLTRRGTTRAGLGLLSLTSETLSKEIHLLGAPASLLDSSSYNVEDHAPMTWVAVRQARDAVSHLTRIAAAELIVAAQAFDLRDPPRHARVAESLRDALRLIVPPLDDDRSMTGELAAVATAIADGAFRHCLGPEVEDMTA